MYAGSGWNTTQAGAMQASPPLIPSSPAPKRMYTSPTHTRGEDAARGTVVGQHKEGDEAWCGNGTREKQRQLIGARVRLTGQ